MGSWARSPLQVATRVRLIAAAPNTFAVHPVAPRIRRFLVDVVGQRQTIRERPSAGLAHALVFWGFLAFGGYTAAEFLAGLGIVDVTHAGWFHAYRAVLTPFAVAVLGGIVLLLVRRAFVRPDRARSEGLARVDRDRPVHHDADGDVPARLAPR